MGDESGHSVADPGRPDPYLEVSFEGEFVQVRSDGKKSAEHARRVWSAVAAACRENDCFKGARPRRGLPR